MLLDRKPGRKLKIENIKFKIVKNEIYRGTSHREVAYPYLET
jgi:hypothetical protein